LSYNSRKYLERCLGSLATQTFKDFEVIIVDNASSDRSVELAKELQFKLNLQDQVRIISNAINLGQTGGDNLGANYAKGDYILLLDVDTWLEENCLSHLAKHIKEKQEVGMWQCRVLNEDGSLRSDGNNCDIYGGICAPYKNDRFFYVTGAFLLIKKKIWNELNGFDEALFAYCEDMDMGWQTRLLGYELSCCKESICYHTGSITLGSYSPKKFFWIERNRIRVLTKNYSITRLLKRIVPTLFLISLRGTFSAFQEHNSNYMKSLISVYFWNIKNLKTTITKRNQIQCQRTVSDAFIEKFLYTYSTELYALKRALFLKGKIQL
jgi:GT2 family glycosyltransferase